MSLIPLKSDINVTSPWKSTIFIGGRRLQIMSDARSESNSESNKKNLVRTLVHF
jgi:hypothetical protein